MEADGQEFLVRLTRFRGEKIERLTIKDEATAMAAKVAVEGGRFTVSAIETKPQLRNPPPPFTTSTLQQEAARKLGFSASHTMRVAQSLYEDGAITYMRTDGVQMAPEALSAARRAITGVTMPAMCPTSRATMRPRPRMRRKRMRRSARPISPRAQPARAIMGASTN
jgi:DNA topoisomerase IA